MNIIKKLKLVKDISLPFIKEKSEQIKDEAVKQFDKLTTPSISIDENDNVFIKDGFLNLKGNNIQICNGKITIDGVEIKPNKDTRFAITKVNVLSDTQSLTVSQGNVSVTGNTGPIKAEQGNVTVGGSVTGNIDTNMGNVKVLGSVTGSTKATMGNVNVGK